MTTYLDFAKKFNENLKVPFEFMKNQREEFVNRNNDLRDLYVANQQLPEKLSATELANSQNNFNLDNLNQNKNDLLEKSRLDTEFGLNNSKFKLDNQDLTQNVTKTSDELLLASNKNSITLAEGESVFNNAMTESFSDPTISETESADALISKTSNNSVARNLANKEVRARFKPSLDSFKTDFKKIQKGIQSQISINNGKKASASDLTNLQVMKNIVSNKEFEKMEFLNSRGLLNEQEQAQYEQVLQLKTILGKPVVDVDIAPQSPAQPTTQTPTVTGNQTPNPQTSVVTETPAQEESELIGLPENINTDFLIGNRDELRAALTSRVTPENAETQLDIITSTLEEEDGMKIFEAMGFSEEQVFNMVERLSEVSQTNSSDVFSASLEQSRSVDNFTKAFPRMGSILTSPVSSENVEQVNSTVRQFISDDNRRKALISTLGGPEQYRNFLSGIDNVSETSQKDTSVISAIRNRFSTGAGVDPDVEELINGNLIAGRFIGDIESAKIGARKIMSSGVIFGGDPELSQKIFEVIKSE